MIVSTFGFAGTTGSPSFVRVELRFERGILFRISGFSSQAAKASHARIRSALISCGQRWPGKAITVNLAPAELSRTSTSFDLPIVLAILASRGVITPTALTHIASAGELGLDGSIRPWQTSIFENPLSLTSQLSDSNKIKTLISPPLNGYSEPRYPHETFTHLSNLIAYLKSSSSQTLSNSIFLPKTSSKSTIPIQNEITFDNIQGEETAKRMAIISAAGSHDLIMLGPPGSGKTVLAKCIHSLLPDLSQKSHSECTSIHAAAGHLFNPNSKRPPWQAPHSSTNLNGLIGSWSNLKSRGVIPGAWSLAHNGVLFLDEFAEFSRGTLEACRAPLESHTISLVRAAGSSELPASALLIAALNPCPCGRGTGRSKSCSCQEGEIKRYLRKISGPVADRIAIHLELGHENTDHSYTHISSNSIPWKEARKTVARVRKWYLEHPGDDRFLQGPQITSKAADLLRSCRKVLKLSHRGLHHVRSVALTSALVDKSPAIEVEHLAEAGTSRLFDRKTWLR
ncbi:MAG: hypothetical protein COA49_08780 [Bacteroidetes bacterium]|nr:MAG: hypothetical protein COA49_08780 [Bacteroidota bacterium]